MNDDDILISSNVALKKYLERIGAEVLNFKRFMVKTYKSNYYVEKAIITIDSKDFSIKSSLEEFAPTAEEAEAIRISFKHINFPKRIDADDLNSLKRQLGGSVKAKDLWAFWDRKTGKIRMAQQRLILEDGRKAYLPWTLYNEDGNWRRMEPEGALPFWKPRTKICERIMVHEGAKAASYVEWLVRDNSSEAGAARRRHPWADKLSEYEHWGLIGGALAPHRADYGELREAKAKEVVYVCDNDWAGKAVLREFSKYYEDSLKGIMFPKDWPAAWDMADPIPETEFEGNYYKGVKLENLIRPATRATKLVPIEEGSEKKIAHLLPQFRQEWLHATRPEVYVHIDFPNIQLSKDEFNNDIAPFSDVVDTARLVKKDAAQKAFKLYYVPYAKPGIYTPNDRSGSYINTHIPSDIKYAEGDRGPWIEYMEYLIPIEADRLELYRWVATLIERPRIKMKYGVLLISEAQGIGKSTLGSKILAPLVGYSNVSSPSESEIVDSNYNYWLAHKRLAIVHEIYAGSSAKAYNRLKNIMTEDEISVNKKYLASYDIENWIHILACSNSKKALLLSADDRRWLVPEVTESIKNKSFWINFNGWLRKESGLGIIKSWAKEFLLDHNPVLEGEHAPDSSMKKKMIEDSMSPGVSAIHALLTYLNRENPGVAIVLTDGMLIDYINEKLYGGRGSERLEKPITVRRAAKNAGWFVGENRFFARDLGGPMDRVRIITNEHSLENKSIEYFKEKGIKFYDINSIRHNI